MLMAQLPEDIGVAKDATDVQKTIAAQTRRITLISIVLVGARSSFDHLPDNANGYGYEVHQTFPCQIGTG